MHYTTLLENVNVSCQPATIINVFVIIVKCQGKNNQSSNISQAIIVGLQYSQGCDHQNRECKNNSGRVLKYFKDRYPNIQQNCLQNKTFSTKIKGIMAECNRGKHYGFITDVSILYLFMSQMSLILRAASAKLSNVC